MNLALSDAMVKSAATAKLAAAPAQGPSTTIITGLGNFLRANEISFTCSAIRTKDCTSSTATAFCI